MKKVIILGSSGSLGSQTKEVLAKYPDQFEITGLAAYSKEEDPSAILVSRDGEKKMLELIENADIVVNVLPGMAGIAVTEASKDKILLLGNKESLVAADFPVENIIPLDSEHNAIYEILRANPNKKPLSITLPCSGGPFYGRKNLDDITVKEALAHPKWDMGPKVTIESATLINKGFEVVEAQKLFNLPIDVKIHPECLIHGIVHYSDEAIAYISKPDMREHIENALCRAIGLEPPRREIRAIKPGEFTLEEPDHETFPGIKLVLAAKDKKAFLEKEEEVITDFLAGKIKLKEIYLKLRHL